MRQAGRETGTTAVGGAANAGVVYKLNPSGHQTVLFSFTGGADGANPLQQAGAGRALFNGLRWLGGGLHRAVASVFLANIDGDEAGRARRDALRPA